MVRSSVLPTQEFYQINLQDMTNTSAEFYELFEELYGPLNCTYSIHTFCSHLLEIRTHGPLTQTSAFKFESFYGEMRRAFVPGTPSPTKQIMKNILLKRKLRKHICENHLYISNYDTCLESNSLIYTYASKNYNIYKISDINGQTVMCQKIGKYPVNFIETPSINWGQVGLFRRGGMCEEITTLNTSEICGKVMNVGKYMVTCPKNVLNEK